MRDRHDGHGAADARRQGRPRAPPAARRAAPSLLTELREGWTEFRQHTWLWATVIQFCLVMMAFNGAFLVLGPVVARAHLGGPAAWGAISASDALGLVAGGLVSLRYIPRRPMLFVVLTGGSIAISPLALALVLPLPVICLSAFTVGLLCEVMMVQWTVQMATRIPSDKLARVSSYDAMGSLAAMPLGALAAGPLAAGIGVSATQFAAAGVIVVSSALTLIPRDIRTIRSGDVPRRRHGDRVRPRRRALPRYRQCPSGSGPRLSTVLIANVDRASVTPGMARTWSSSSSS